MSILSSLQNLFNNKDKEKEKIIKQNQAEIAEIKEEKIEGIPMTQEEKETVSIICGVIAANACPDSEFKVKSIVRTK